MRRSTLALIAVLLPLTPLLIAPVAAEAQGPAIGTESAQSPTARNGFHFSVGLGSASMGASCDQCDPNPFVDRLNGLSGFVQLGGAVNPQLVITGEFLGWVSNDDPIFRRVAGLSLGVLGYPSPNSGFFVKGAFGGVRAIVEDDFISVQTDAWMATTGVGFDIPVSSALMITPYLNYVRSFGGETTANGFVSPVPLLPNAFQFGAALTVR
jgi:hypothetical protein